MENGPSINSRNPEEVEPGTYGNSTVTEFCAKLSELTALPFVALADGTTRYFSKPESNELSTLVRAEVRHDPSDHVQRVLLEIHSPVQIITGIGAVAWRDGQHIGEMIEGVPGPEMKEILFRLEAERVKDLRFADGQEFRFEKIIGSEQIVLTASSDNRHEMFWGGTAKYSSGRSFIANFGMRTTQLFPGHSEAESGMLKFPFISQAVANHSERIMKNWWSWIQDNLKI